MEMDQRRNHREIMKYFEMTKNENIHSKTYKLQQKSVLRGKVIVVNTYTKKKKDLKSII